MDNSNDGRATPTVSIAFMCALIGVLGAVWINIYKRTASEVVATQFTAGVVGYAVAITLFGYGACWITKRRGRWSYVFATLCCVLLVGWGSDTSKTAVQQSTVHAKSMDNPFSKFGPSFNPDSSPPTTMPPLPAGFTLDATSAPATTPPAQQSFGGDSQTWASDVSAFQQAHPEIVYGHNIQILQAYLNHLVNTGTMTNKEMLDVAYVEARRDSQWSQTP